MPLRAVFDDNDIFAHEIDAMEWQELQKSYREHNLLMPCCGNKAIPKTSKCGTQFFAHERRGPCESAKETEHHLRLKAILADAAKKAGWSVTTEWRGQTDTGEEWVADVFCTKGKSSVALEAQWSPQTPNETRRRQTKYAQSGVRCAWFFKVRKTTSSMDLMRPNVINHSLISEQATPTFYFKEGDEVGEFNVPEFQMSVEQVARHLMLGEIKYYPQMNTELKASIIYDAVECSWCEKNANIILGLVLYNHLNKPFHFFGMDLEWLEKLYETKGLHEDQQLDSYEICKITSFSESKEHHLSIGGSGAFYRAAGSCISYKCPHCKGDHSDGGFTDRVQSCCSSKTVRSTHQFSLLNGEDLPLIKGRWTDMRPEASWSIKNIGYFEGNGWHSSPFYKFWDDNQNDCKASD